MCMSKVTLFAVIMILPSGLLALKQYRTDTEVIREVEPGETVLLKCDSNDAEHNFLFWYFVKSGMVIGPANQFNSNKFKYEVLSGNLTIRAFTSNEEGVYNCISDGVTNRDISIYSVNLILKHRNTNLNPKEQMLQQEYSINLWKTSAVLGSILISLIIILVVLHMYHKKAEKHNYFDIAEENDDDDEDSTEELFTREPSTSGIKSPLKKDETSDNFEKVYTAINMNT